MEAHKLLNISKKNERERENYEKKWQNILRIESFKSGKISS